MTQKRLAKYTLDFDKKSDEWRLKNDATKQVVERFEVKGDATRGGVLQQAIGPGGGSVRIKTQDGKYQEERTYPRTADPKGSPG